MFKVFQAQHLAEAHLVCSLLQAEGITAEIQGHERFTTYGLGSSVPGILPTIWISDDADSDKASELIARYIKGEPNHIDISFWQCPECSETHETQFLSCWKCGASKPDQAPA